MEEEGQVSSMKQQIAESPGEKLLGNPHLETADRMRANGSGVEVGHVVILETCSTKIYYIGHICRHLVWLF